MAKKMTKNTTKKTTKKTVKKTTKKTSTKTPKEPAKKLGKNAGIKLAAKKRAATKPTKRSTKSISAADAKASGTTPAAVKEMRALETARRATRQQVEKDRQDRIAAFRTSLASKQKKRPPGVMALTAKGEPRILAEGDSWFDYPIPFSGGGVIDHLKRISGADILNLAKAGDEVRNMMGVKQRKRIEELLGDKTLNFDVFLFSGGGNDIAGDQCCLWLNPASSTASASDAINTSRFKVALDLIEVGYRDLIAIRDRLAPNCVIVGHGYDTPQPSKVGVCGLGPWLKPSMDYRGWTIPSDQFTIAKQMLGEFALMVKRLSETTNKFVYVQTQGLLNPVTEWANEIHPNSAGFQKVAAAFNNELAKLFPKTFNPE